MKKKTQPLISKDNWLKRNRLLALTTIIALILLFLVLILALNDLKLSARVAGIVLVLFIISTWRYHTIKTWLSERRIYRWGTRVIGTVTHLQERHGMTFSVEGDGSFVDDYWVTYKFTTTEGLGLFSRRSIDEKLFSDLQNAGELTIAYDPVEPNNNIPVQSEHNFLKIIAFTWNTLFITALALGAIPFGLVELISR